MQIERDAFYAMLGIAMRAGQLSLGESGVLKAISSGAALFMILDAGASDNTKKKFRDSCAFYQVPLYETVPDRLGTAIGKPGRMSAAIARGSLGGKLLGAGGGFLLFYCEPDKQERLRVALRKKEFPFSFEKDGTSVAYIGDKYWD